MSLDPLKLGISILLFLPGFVFVEVREHHLARERKPQFEKTLEIILWSAFIWLIAFAMPRWWPFNEGRSLLLHAITMTVGGNAAPERIQTLPTITAWFFLSVNAWTFVIANLWGIIRKSFYVNAIVKSVTGRDWHPTVLIQLFRTSLNKGVVVRLDDRRYLGVLFIAPDRRDDNYLILKDVSLLPELTKEADDQVGPDRTIEPLPLVQSLLLRIDQIQEIQLLEENILRRIEGQSLWNRVSGFFRRH